MAPETGRFFEARAGIGIATESGWPGARTIGFLMRCALVQRKIQPLEPSRQEASQMFHLFISDFSPISMVVLLPSHSMVTEPVFRFLD